MLIFENHNYRKRTKKTKAKAGRKKTKTEVASTEAALAEAASTEAALAEAALAPQQAPALAPAVNTPRTRAAAARELIPIASSIPSPGPVTRR